MKHNLLVLGTYPIEIPNSGGKYVLHNLFKRLTYQFNIVFLSLIESDKVKKETLVSSDFTNIQIPQSLDQAQIQWKEEEKHNVGLFDVIQIDTWNYNIEYLEQVKKYVKTSDVIILAHPFLINLIESLNPKIPVIYHAIDLELNQKKSILNPSLLEKVKKTEQSACTISDQIWVSSFDEQELFVSIYGINTNKIKILPHGADLSTMKFIERTNHEKIKSRTKDLVDKTIFVFTGSWHPPNLESLEFIISYLSPLNKNYLFFIVGSVGDYYLHKHTNTTTPDNVILLGPISNDEKNVIYELADYAINPMFSGAGTNLKMLEYMSVGLPMVSTDFGARGIKISKNTLLCKKNEFIDYIKNITTSSYKNSPSIQENYQIVKNEYDYDLISKNCARFLSELINPNIANLEMVLGNVIIELKTMTINYDDSIIDTISKETESLFNSTNR